MEPIDRITFISSADGDGLTLIASLLTQQDGRWNLILCSTDARSTIRLRPLIEQITDPRIVLLSLADKPNVKLTLQGTAD